MVGVVPNMKGTNRATHIRPPPHTSINTVVSPLYPGSKYEGSSSVHRHPRGLDGGLGGFEKSVYFYRARISFFISPDSSAGSDLSHERANILPMVYFVSLGYIM